MKFFHPRSFQIYCDLPVTDTDIHQNRTRVGATNSSLVPATQGVPRSVSICLDTQTWRTPPNLEGRCRRWVFFSGLLFPGPRCVFSVYGLVYHDPTDAIQQRRDGCASGALQISRRSTHLTQWSPNTWASGVGLTGDCSRRSPVSRTAN